MDVQGFKEKMAQYKKAKVENPQLKYWDWKKENDLQYQLYKAKLPENLRTETDSYNLYGAYQANMQPELSEDGFYHLGSRNPETGEILKSKNHPTYEEAIKSEINAGYFPYEKNGKTYTKTYSPIDISGYADGSDYIKYNPNITGEGYDSKGYYAQAMNPLPEIVVQSNKYINQSEINRTRAYISGTNINYEKKDITPGRGALEIVSPEFDLLTGVRGITNMVYPKSSSILKTTDKRINWSDPDLQNTVPFDIDYVNNQNIFNKAKQNINDFYGSKDYYNRIDNAYKETKNKIFSNEYIPTILKSEEEIPYNKIPININNYIEDYGVTQYNNRLNGPVVWINKKAHETQSEFLDTINHELAHATVKRDKVFNKYYDNIIPYNNSITDLRSPIELSKILDIQDLDELSKVLNFENYITKPGEIRARAYSILQRAKREGLSTDQYIDKYTFTDPDTWFSQIGGSDQLNDLLTIMEPKSIKKYLNNFLSIGAPASMYLKNNKNSGYADGSDGIKGDMHDYTQDIKIPTEKQLDLQKWNYTDINTNTVSPFYNRISDTYGTVNLPDIEVSAPLTWEASNKQAARRGANAAREGLSTAFKVAAPIVGGAGLAAMSGAGLMSAAITPIDVAAIAADPTMPLNYIPFIKEYNNIINFGKKQYNLFKRVRQLDSRVNYLQDELKLRQKALRDKTGTDIDLAIKEKDNQIDQFINEYEQEHPEELVNLGKQNLTKLRDNYNELRRRSYNSLKTFISAEDFKGLTKDQQKILNIINKENPDYIQFSKKLNLNPLQQSTMDKWIEKQRTGIRGVYSDKPNADIEDLKDMFTATKKVNKGGDRLRTNGGLYVSNSSEIANRFSRSLNDRPGTAAYAILKAKDIDRNQSIVDQLRTLRRRIYPFDLTSDVLNIDIKKLIDKGYIGKEAIYTTGKGEILPAYETSYFAENPGTKVSEIVDYKTSNQTKNIRGRWGANAGGASIEDQLYSPRFFGNSFGDFLHEVRTQMESHPEMFSFKKQLPPDQKRTLWFCIDNELEPQLREKIQNINKVKEENEKLLDNRWNKLSDLKYKNYKIKNKIKEVSKITTASSIPTALISVSAYNQYKDSKSSENYNDFYSNYKNLNINDFDRDIDLYNKFFSSSRYQRIKKRLNKLETDQDKKNFIKEQIWLLKQTKNKGE